MESLLQSAHGFQGRTTLPPHRRRAAQLGGRLPGRDPDAPPVPARAGSRRLGQACVFWLSAAPVHARFHVTQTDPGTSASPRLSSRPCPLRVQSRVRERAPSWGVGGGTARGPGAPRADPHPPCALLLPLPRSPRKRRWRRHGGADGSGESHRDGLPQGTRVRQPPKPWPAEIADLSGLSPSLASGSMPQPDQHHGSRALFTVFLPPGRRLWPSQGTRASRLQWTGERSDRVAGAWGTAGRGSVSGNLFPDIPCQADGARRRP